MNNHLKFDKLKIILCLISVFILTIVLVFKYDSLKEKGTSDALKFKKEYEEYNDKENSNGKKYPTVNIDKDNNVKYSDASEIVGIIENGTGVIYLGYPKCPWCRNAVPVLLQAAEDSGINNIYYMNMYEERDSYIVDDNDNLILEKEGTDSYKKLLKALDSVLEPYLVENKKGEKIDTGEKRIYVPIVVFVKDGEIVGVHMDTVESQKDPYVILNDEQKDELYNIYIGYMHDVLNDICDERC